MLSPQQTAKASPEQAETRAHSSGGSGSEGDAIRTKGASANNNISEKSRPQTRRMSGNQKTKVRANAAIKARDRDAGHAEPQPATDVDKTSSESADSESLGQNFRPGPFHYSRSHSVEGQKMSHVPIPSGQSGGQTTRPVAHDSNQTLPPSNQSTYPTNQPHPTATAAADCAPARPRTIGYPAFPQSGRPS